MTMFPGMVVGAGLCACRYLAQSLKSVAGVCIQVSEIVENSHSGESWLRLLSAAQFTKGLRSWLRRRDI
jgi:hypothetical protein